MDSFARIVPFHERNYEMVPVEKIRVINSRNREKDQFDMNVQSIDQVGLLKPIRVNSRFVSKTGFYELICGEGRLIAHQQLGVKEIKAEVVSVSRKEAYLQSLIENIARTKPGTMDFARELKRLHEEGWTFKQIAQVACKSENYVRDYIRLVDQGEERLIQGVETGIFPIQFAMNVASSEDSQMQHILMDAFDQQLITTRDFAQARKILSRRAMASADKKVPKQYTVSQLKHDIATAAKHKTSFVREAKTKENRFLTLLNSLNHLWRDPSLRKLLVEEKLQQRPALAGDFTYEQEENASASKQ